MAVLKFSVLVDPLRRDSAFKGLLNNAIDCARTLDCTAGEFVLLIMNFPSGYEGPLNGQREGFGTSGMDLLSCNLRRQKRAEGEGLTNNNSETLTDDARDKR